METLGKALKKLIQDLGIEYDVMKNQAVVFWPEVVGRRIAKISHAEKVDGNILFVKVYHDSWRNELLFLKKDIINKINKRIGRKIIADIKLY